jgi:ankyrin repeat protein
MVPFVHVHKAMTHLPTPSLYQAAARGDIAAVRAALDAGAAVDERDPTHGRTPLMAASQAGNLAVARLLLDYGADVNARAWTPESAPPEIAASMSPDSIQYMLIGDTALTLAAAAGSEEIAALLLDRGADISAATTHGYDALINAAFAGARRAPDTTPLVKLLLDRGASPARATSYGETALKTAAGFGLFDVLRLLLDAGADPVPLRWTPLMHAVVFGTLAEVHAALAVGAELEARDGWGRTALHLGLEAGKLDAVQALHAAGASLAPGGHDQRSPLVYAVRRPDALDWLLAHGCDGGAAADTGLTPLAAAVEAGAVESVRLLLAAGARAGQPDEYGQPLIERASDVEVVRVLLVGGADLNVVSDTMRLALFGLPGDGAITATQAEYQQGRARRFGTANPEVMDVPFWRAMVRARTAAYTARVQFGDEPHASGPVWCFQRFGRTLTALPGGGFVEIAGEHEDFYDPDFCIYNDLVVYDGAGNFTIYGYPEAVFPPTDFHSATLVGSHIYLIGSLGYQGTRRPGYTPVYRIDITTWSIEALTTHGRPPGWISRHTAHYDAETARIVIRGGKRSVRRAGSEQYEDNSAAYALDLATLTWRRLRS